MGDFPRKLLKCPQDGVLQPEESMPIRAAKHQSWTLRCDPVLHPVVTFARHRRDGRLGRRVRLVPERDVAAADVHELWHCVEVLQAVATFLHGSSHHTAKF